MDRETFVQRQEREANELAVTNGLMPCVTPAMVLAMREIDIARDQLEAGWKRVVHAIAGNPSSRLEHATRLMDMPPEMVAAFVKAEGLDYAEHICVMIEQRLKKLREDMRSAAAGEAA